VAEAAAAPHHKAGQPTRALSNSYPVHTAATLSCHGDGGVGYLHAQCDRSGHENSHACKRAQDRSSYCASGRGHPGAGDAANAVCVAKWVEEDVCDCFLYPLSSCKDHYLCLPLHTHPFNLKPQCWTLFVALKQHSCQLFTGGLRDVQGLERTASSYDTRPKELSPSAALRIKKCEVKDKWNELLGRFVVD